MKCWKRASSKGLVMVILLWKGHERKREAKTLKSLGSHALCCRGIWRPAFWSLKASLSSLQSRTCWNDAGVWAEVKVPSNNRGWKWLIIQCWNPKGAAGYSKAGLNRATIYWLVPMRQTFFLRVLHTCLVFAKCFQFWLHLFIPPRALRHREVE